MSIKKIAEMTGLSTATVSHVINNSRAVSEKSRRKVELAMQQIGYRPNRAARTLKTQKSNTIAMLMPEIEPGNPSNMFFMNVLSGAKETLETNGYDLLISTYHEQSGGAGAAAILQKQWVDGLLAVPNRLDQPLETAGLPTVLIDRTVQDAACPCVHTDNRRAAADATGLLLKNGKTHIGYIGGPLSFSTGRDRLQGYQDALAAAHITLRPKWIQSDLPHSVENGASAANMLIKRGVDAIFVSNNVLAIGALQTLQRQQIAIPQQIALVAFEDYEWMELTSPPLTTVRQESFQMGSKAAEVLLDILAENPVPDDVVIPAKLILRQSHIGLS